jgi:hypothetical protein
MQHNNSNWHTKDCIYLHEIADKSPFPFEGKKVDHFPHMYHSNEQSHNLITVAHKMSETIAFFITNSSDELP